MDTTFYDVSIKAEINSTLQKFYAGFQRSRVRGLWKFEYRHSRDINKNRLGINFRRAGRIINFNRLSDGRSPGQREKKFKLLSEHLRLLFRTENSYS